MVCMHLCILHFTHDHQFKLPGTGSFNFGFGLALAFRVRSDRIESKPGNANARRKPARLRSDVSAARDERSFRETNRARA